MIRATANTQPGVLDAIRRELADSPRKIGEIAQKVARSRSAQAMLVDLKTEPGKPTYPLRWKSERQRRFVMAKLRRENNLPYRRTHDLSRAWRIVALIPELGVAEIILVNDTPYAQFVQGQYQQPYHIDTGWQNVQTINTRYASAITGEYLQEWNNVFNA